jgi:hypothetical protein
VSEAWSDYLAAAQRLGTVRRGVAAAVASEAAALAAARDELAAARARLAPQQARLRDEGVPDAFLTPTPDELAAAAAAVEGGPGPILAELREARVTADAADAALVGTGSWIGTPVAGVSEWPPRLRNLLVYGPFAIVVLVVQVALYLSVSETALPVYVPLCGLAMPAAAFGLGWLTIGRVFPPGPTGKVERTPVLGAAVSLAPVLAICVAAAALAVVG